MTTKTRTCHLCEAMCGLLLDVEEGRVQRVRGDSRDPFSRGHICPKGFALAELHADPDRLRRPQRRRPDGRFSEIAWDEALDETAERIASIQREHGRNGFGLYVGNPSIHNHGTTIYMQAFIGALRTKNRFDANSQDANPRLLASMWLYGDPLSVPVPDVDRTDFLLMLGANPAASNGSLMGLGDVRGRLRGIAARGARFVLIDPRRTETAAWATEHHFIRPGGDAALLLAMLHVIFAEGLCDSARVSAEASGLDAVRAVAARFSPERVARAVGIDAGTIRTLATDFAHAPRAAAYGRVGTCLNRFGVTASFLIDVLNVVTGNLDRAGGSMFPTPAADVASLGRKMVGQGLGRWHSRVRKLPEFLGQLPGSVMAEEIETPGDGQIRGMMTIAGNPVLSTAGGERLGKALGTLDFMVSVDPYITATSRHAHIILPPTSPLSRSHYDVVLCAFAVRNFAKYSPPTLPREPGELDDWEILAELGRRLGGLNFKLPVVNGLMRAASRKGWHVHPDTILDLLIRSGPYGDKFSPLSNGLSLRKLREHPHGVDLGPLVPRSREVVRTRDGRVALALPDPLADDLGRLESWVDRGHRDGIELIGRRHVRSNNSWMHNLHSLTKGPDRGALLVHPETAERLGLVDGGPAEIRGRHGSIRTRVAVSDTVAPGVVSLPHGFGHQAVADAMRIAGSLDVPNKNAVTDPEDVEPIAGTAILNGVSVEILPLHDRPERARTDEAALG